MLNIDIICVGKLKEQYFKDAIEEYSKRLTKYCKLEIIEVADEKLPSKINDSIINEIKNKECLKIKSKIKKDSYTISLDLSRKKCKFYSIFKKTRRYFIKF